MDTTEFIEFMKYKFKMDVLKVFIRYKNRVLLDMQKETLYKVAELLIKELNFRFIIATGLDAGKCFEIIYHFSDDKTGLIANLRVSVPKNKAVVESLTPLITAADWIECEMHELLGIEFRNHPNMRSLLSDGNWESGDYPYRKQKQKENQRK